MVENLATIQAWCSREHETMVRIQAENNALLSEMQAPPEVSFNIVSSQGLCDKLADCINTDIPTLLDDVNRLLSSTGCSTDTPFQPTRGDTDFVDEQQSFKPSKAYLQGGSEHSDGSDQCAEARGSHRDSEHSGGSDQCIEARGWSSDTGDEPHKVLDTAQQLDAEERFDITLGAAEEAPNSYANSSHSWGCPQVPKVFQNFSSGVKESSQGEALTSLRHVFHEEESFQARTHQYSRGVGEELYRRVQHSCPVPSAGVPCRPRYAPSSGYGASARSGHSSALGSPTNVHGPCLDHHHSGANMDAQRCNQPTLAWSRAHGPQRSNQQGSCNFGSRFAPNYEQRPAHVCAPEQPRGLRARQPRAMAPGTVSIMVRNIPARYNKDGLLLELPVERYRFNMLYLPANRRGMSLGYAFLNFPSTVDALAFQRRWHGRYLSNHGANKHLDISQARVQGLVESLRDMLEKMDTLAWRNAASVPLVFEGNRLLDINEVLRQHGLVQPDHVRINTPEN